MSTTVFSRDSLESSSALYMQQQSPFPHNSSSESLPHQYRMSPDQPQLRHNTSDPSLNSDMIGSDPSLHPPQPFDQSPSTIDQHSTNVEQRPRTSSEVTVNNNLDRHYHKPATTPLPPPPPSFTPERDSNLFEISEEEMNGGYLARSVVAPGHSFI